MVLYADDLLLYLSVCVMPDTCLPGSPGGPLRPGGPCLVSPEQQRQQHFSND